MHKIFISFDVEDFINPNAIYALQRILETLKKYNLKAIFFITGHMAEKISNYPKIINDLKDHEVGYHSSSHSVHPTIPEFTDVKSYRKAYEKSIDRETSHINPITGKPEGEGGLYILQKLFYPKRIRAFRAPGMCWTPPHLEALRDLGIRHDFSTNLAYSEPVSYKGITFYPYTTTQKWNGGSYDYQILFTSLIRRKITVLDLHPTLFVNQTEWDSIYYNGNPKILSRVSQKPREEIELAFQKFELLIKWIKGLQKVKIVDTSITFNAPDKNLKMTRQQIDNCYQASVQWIIKRFHYRPKFLKNHFYEFFREACQ